MDTIVQQALDLWTAESDRRQAELDLEEKQAWANRLLAGRECYRNIFGVEPTVNEDGYFLLHCPEILSDYNPYTPFVALNFSASHGQHLVVVGKCPRCQGTLHMGCITKLVDLGAVLSCWDVPYHECDYPRTVRMTPEAELFADLKEVDGLMSVKGQSTRAWTKLNLINARTMILIAERLRKVE